VIAWLKVFRPKELGGLGASPYGCYPNKKTQEENSTRSSCQPCLGFGYSRWSPCWSSQRLPSVVGFLSNFQLQPEMEDKHIWRFSANGQYSAKTAYEGFFLGATIFRPWEIIWKTWAPAKCPFFMWLVAHNKCWTADRLAKRGLPHPDRCPMCDQESETINHLLIGCSFAREFWHRFLSQVGLQALSPRLSDSSFYDWWERITIDCSVLVLQGINSLIILGAWTIWTQRNNCVFDGAAPDVARALILSSE